MLLKYLETNHFEIYGLDISEYAISKIPKTLSPKCCVGSILNLPYAEREFDCVINIDLLEHIKPQYLYRAIEECLCVARRVVYFEITTIEDIIFIDNDPTHLSKYSRNYWFNLLKIIGGVNWKVRYGFRIPIIRNGVFIMEKI